MARRARALIPRRHARLEIVPMIDVMMFLLVFFVMIALSMIPNAGLPVQLPTAATTRPLKATPLAVAIDKSGQLHVDGKIISLPELAARLQKSADTVTSVIISADREVDFQHVVSAMDAVRAAGVATIGLAASPRP